MNEVEKLAAKATTLGIAGYTRFFLFVITLIALAAPPVSTSAQWDNSSGTNAILTFADTANVGGGILKPIVIGVLVFCLGIGLYKRVTRKAGVGT